MGLRYSHRLQSKITESTHDMTTTLRVLCLLILSMLIPTSWADDSSPRLNAIKERGTITVGVKTDYPPWGFYAEDGSIIGLEVDLAQDIADRLGVELRLQKVTASNRIDKLESGSIDLLIATMGDTEKRRQQTGIIVPSYYSSGATIIVHKKNTQITHWSDLYGQPVCLSKNAFFNRDLIERFLLDAHEFEGTLDNLAALNIGNCIGWVFDDTAVANLLKEDRWQDFNAPLNSIMVQPWAIAVPLAEQHTDFGQLMSDAIIDWHRTGKLLSLETKWGVRNSQFLVEQQEKWQQKDHNNHYRCQRQADNSFPLDCLSRNSLSAASAIKDNLLSQWGIDFPPLYDDYSQNYLLKGISLTLLLSVFAIVGSLTFGVVMGTILYRLPKGWSWIVNQVNNVFRMTPPLLNLYIIFFGLGGIVALHYDIHFDAITVAVVVFTLYAGSSNAALYCAALKTDAVHHPDYSLRQLLPAAFQHAYEGINANSINIVKAVGLASMISVPELISSSNSIIAEYGSKSEMMTFLLVFYFLLVYTFIFLLDRLKQFVTPKRPVVTAPNINHTEGTQQ